MFLTCYMHSETLGESNNCLLELLTYVCIRTVNINKLQTRTLHIQLNNTHYTK